MAFFHAHRVANVFAGSLLCSNWATRGNALNDSGMFRGSGIEWEKLQSFFFQMRRQNLDMATFIGTNQTAVARGVYDREVKLIIQFVNFSVVLLRFKCGHLGAQLLHLLSNPRS